MRTNTSWSSPRSCTRWSNNAITSADVVRFAGSTFVNADCVAGARQHLADASVDLIVTDPPYGIEGDRLHAHYNRDERFVVDGYVEVPADRYNAFSRGWIAEAERVLRPGGALYVVSGYTHLYDVLDALRATSLVEVNHLIWKYSFGVHTTTKYVSSHYHILYYAKPGGKRTFNLQSRFASHEPGSNGSPNYRDREDVWIVNREYKPGRTKNKNELPHALLQKMLAYSSNEGDLVCDFFMGGCSTAAVAIGMNRRFVGFEISPQIFAVAVPPLGGLSPGSALAGLRRPAPTEVRNRGKAWTPEAVAHALERSRALAAGGCAKGEIVERLAAELERGAWAIRKLLKRDAGK